MTCEPDAGAMGDTGYTGMTGATGRKRRITKRQAVHGCPGPKGFFSLYFIQCRSRLRNAFKIGLIAGWLSSEMY